MSVVMRFSRLLLVGALGCGTAPAQSPRVAREDTATMASPARPHTEVDPEALQIKAERLLADLEAMQNLRLVGMDDGPVPGFELTLPDGRELDSSSLIGRVPFVVAFFATWCEACEQKLRSLRSALDESGPMLVIPVSFDAPGSRDRVERYLRALGIVEPAVSAAEYPLLVMSYNPFDTIPLLVIVGQNGGLVDYQLGLEREHEQRLVASLKLAHVIPPLARPAGAIVPAEQP